MCVPMGAVCRTCARRCTPPKTSPTAPPTDRPLSSRVAAPSWPVSRLNWFVKQAAVPGDGWLTFFTSLQGAADKAGLECQVELSPLCNGERPGMPSAFAVFMKQKLEHLLCEPRRPAVEPEQLMVDEERGVGWRLYLDVYCVDDDGSVFDAVLLAAVAALKDTTLPAVAWSETTHRFVEATGGGAGWSVKLSTVPLSLTFALVESWVVADPSHAEEDVAAALVSVVWSADTEELCCVEKRGGAAIGQTELETCLAAARKRVAQLGEQLKNAK